MKNYEASMSIQMSPHLGERKEDIRVIDKVIEYIKSKGLNTIVGPFDTCVEGSLDEILEILKGSILVAEKEGAKDIMTYIKIAYNPLGVMTIDEKISKHNK